MSALRPGIRTLSACPEVTTPPQYDARPPHPCQMTRYGNGAQRGPRPGAALRPVCGEGPTPRGVPSPPGAPGLG
eukprot:4772696-Prymnesium_polylepis.1